jgi:hypothetical protein
LTTDGGHPNKRIEMAQMTTNELTIATFLFIVAPPFALLFFYKILGPDARKKFDPPSPPSSDG